MGLPWLSEKVSDPIAPAIHPHLSSPLGHFWYEVGHYRRAAIAYNADLRQLFDGGVWDRSENIDVTTEVPHLFIFPSGYRIQFNRTEGDEGIQRLELDVLDLTRAHRFLKEKGYVGSEDGSSITIRPERLHGMQLVCREAIPSEGA